MRFAVESQLDVIAEELGIDPVEIRLRNARQPGEELPNGDNVHNCGLSECIRKAAEETGFRERYGQGRKSGGRYRRGIGIGVSAYFGGSLVYPNSSSAVVKLNDDGSLTLLTGAIDIGQGAETILTQIVAEELQVPPAEIRVVAADTETTPVDIGAWISGGAYVTGNAARKAAGEVRAKLAALAADALEASPADLTFKDKTVSVVGSPSRSMTFAQLYELSVRTRRGDPIVGEGHWRTMRDEPAHPSLATAKGRWTENYAFDAQVAEVEVDTETGEARLLRAVTAHDCGFPINPQLVDGQIEGQVSMALGHAFLEEVAMEEGRTLSPSWLEYRMPTIHEMAASHSIDVITERYEVGKPYRTKEVGEGYVSAILAAIANAVYDAVGVRLHRTPFTPERILKGLTPKDGPIPRGAGQREAE
jgi:4-hydroxybenzoyl-CoA reductase subunit alpha